MEIAIIQQYYNGCNTEIEIDIVTGKRIAAIYGPSPYDEIAQNTRATEAMAYLMFPGSATPERQRWAMEVLTKSQDLLKQKEEIILEGKFAKQQIRLAFNGV